jgi:predicted HicB family RNase H-like nuclease
MMQDMLKYKGYYGSIHYDADTPIFYGKLEFIKALVSYEAEDAIGIKQAFEAAVDDYLELCKQENIIPETPFKGSLNVRLGHQLHEKVALLALREDVSINKYICAVLTQIGATVLVQKG